MDEQKLQAQVPEEKLEEVSGGFFFDFDYGPKDYWHYSEFLRRPPPGS